MNNSLKNYKWEFLDLPNNQSLGQLLEDFPNLTGPLGKIKAQLLWQKGLTSYEAAKARFRPQLKNAHDPFLMRDMDKAVERLKTALQKQEKIRLYGDYDVDGTTAVALLLRTLGKHHPDLDYYISDRYQEGYGLSQKGIERAIEDQVQVLITLDCGIRAHEKIAMANKAGIDVIVCDHHEPEYPLPPALAVLDIKRKDCDYPYKALSGCGVGFKLMQGLYKTLGWPQKELDKVMELLAVSVAADIVPVTGENHLFMRLGLEALAKQPSPGLLQLLTANKVLERKPIEELDTNDLVFGIAPPINAAGRLQHAKQAVELLTETDGQAAAQKAVDLVALNDVRKKTDQETTREALAIVDMEPGFEEKNTTVVYRPGWHKGVVGIVASRLQERHYRPTIVFTKSGENTITGSARSVQAFNLLDALNDCKDFLGRYGGHAFAAGLTMEESLLDHFKEHFEAVVKSKMGEAFQEGLEINLVLDFLAQKLRPKDLMGLLKFLEQLGPYGPENWRPVFYTENLVSFDKPKLMKRGEGEGHLKMRLCQAGMDYSINTIAFGFGEYQDLLFNRPFSACYYLELNHFRGNITPQIRIKDITIS